jgi:lipopolysaccharide export LptBFGC system permease protein LptF
MIRSDIYSRGTSSLAMSAGTSAVQMEVVRVEGSAPDGASGARSPGVTRRVRNSRSLFAYIFRGLVVNCLVAFLVLETVQGIIFTVRATEGYSFDLLVIFPVLLRAFGQAMTFTLPLSLLFGAGFFIGRLNADRETVALRSFGLSPAQLLVPVAVLGVSLTALSYELNSQWVPRLRFANRNVGSLILDQLGYLGEGWNLEFSTGPCSLWIYHYDGPFLEGIFFSVSEPGEGVPVSKEILEKVEAPSYPLYVYAERGLVSRGRGDLEGRLILDLQGVDVFLDNDFFDASSTSDFMHRIRMEHWRWIPEFPQKTPGIKDLDRRQLASLTAERWDDCLLAEAGDPDLKDRALREYSILVAEFHRRISLSLTALTFPLAAFVLGLFMQSTNRLLPFFVSSTLVPVLYFGLELFARQVSRRGVLPWAMGELGNLSIILLCLFLLFWMNRSPRA